MSLMRIIGYIFILLAMVCCAQQRRSYATRAAYWWRTTLSVDSQQRQFLAAHNVRRLYVRYFDVVQGGNGDATPNATLRFHTGVPADVEVIPVVFIVNDVMRGDATGLAQKVLSRILQISETNGISGVREVQIDCDWTLTTQRTFYAFMADMLRECHQRGLKLSATVRFHQLMQQPPPADSGVLMAYNTGNFADINCQKPILDIAAVMPYLRYLGSYQLPLSVAYPAFSWRLLFRSGSFVGIVHYDGELPVLAGDTIVTRQPTIADIIEAKQAIEHRLKTPVGETILFDLSNQNITRFNATEYETIFNP